MLSPTDCFRKNLRSSTLIKLEPEMWFSGAFAAYIRQMASYEQLYPDAMCICVLNVVSICCSNSSIRRRGNSYVPLNLYNFVIGKSDKRMLLLVKWLNYVYVLIKLWQVGRTVKS